MANFENSKYELYSKLIKRINKYGLKQYFI